MEQSQQQDIQDDSQPEARQRHTEGTLGVAISEFEFALSQLEAQIQHTGHKEWRKSATPYGREPALEAENEVLKQKQQEMRLRLDATIARLDRLMDSQKVQED